MDDSLISKKELLELTGISYGQLYRWKRKDIIPDEWFIRKSTFTGQETYFPRRQILERIERIVSLKDGLSLDELAEMFSLSTWNTAMNKSELLSRKLVSADTLRLFLTHVGDAEAFSFEQVIYMNVLEQLLSTQAIESDEAGELLTFLADRYPHFDSKACDLVLIRKLGVCTSLLISSPHELFVDSGSQVIARVSLAASIEALKAKLS